MGAFGKELDDGSPSVWIGESGEGGCGSAFVGVSWWVDLAGRRDRDWTTNKTTKQQKLREKVSLGIENWNTNLQKKQ